MTCSDGYQNPSKEQVR